MQLQDLFCSCTFCNYYLISVISSAHVYGKKISSSELWFWFFFFFGTLQYQFMKFSFIWQAFILIVWFEQLWIQAICYWLKIYPGALGTDSVTHKMCYCKISQRLKGTGLVVRVFQLLWNLAGVAEVPVKFQGDMNILLPSLVPVRLCETLQKDIVCDIESVPWRAHFYAKVAV